MNPLAALDSTTQAAIDSIAESVGNKQCILFLGAAVHCGPPDDAPWEYGEDERPPLGRSFSRHLAKESQFAEQFPDESIEDLQRVALHYEQFHSRNRLVQEIKRAMHAEKRPSQIVRALAALPFPMIITTNYDQLFERALREPSVGKDPKVISYHKNEHIQTAPITSDPTPESPVLLKLHGDIENIADIVITDEDYIQFVLRMSDKDPYNPVPLAVRSRLTQWSTLFLGYSLQDYNLRLLFKTLRWQIDPSSIPDTYSVDLTPDPLIVAIWQDRDKYVKYIVQNVWEFVPNLYRLVTGKEMT